MPKPSGTDDGFYVAVPGHLVADVASEVVILHRSSGAYFGLNPSGRRVWELIQEGATTSTLVDTIVAEYDVDPGAANSDIGALLSDLVAAGLAERRS